MPKTQPVAPPKHQALQAVPIDHNASIAIRLEAEPRHLNPMLTGDGLAQRVALGDIYQGLLCRDGPLDDIEPCLAKRAVVSDDGLRWTFRLRSGVVFHDGHPLTTDDVVRSIEVVARGELPTPLTSEFDDLSSVTTDPSVGEIVVTFSERRLDRRGAFARLPILRQADLATTDLVSAPIHRRPNGTGPLRFVSWKPGVSIELARYASYWGEEAAAGSIVYRIVSSRERAYAMVRNGRLDLATQLPVAEALDVASLSPSLSAYSYERPAYLAAVYNARSSSLSKPSQRLAMTMLLDREAVRASVLAGFGEPISGPFVGGERDPSVAAPPFDRQAAAREFRSSARAEILYPSESSAMARIADIWASDARGVAKLSPTPAPFAVVLERLRRGEFDIALLAFSTGRELDMFTRLHSSQIGGENYGGIADEVLDHRLSRARIASEPTDAARAVHRRIAELAPYAFIATDVRAGLVRAAIGGLDRGDGLAARFLWRKASR